MISEHVDGLTIWHFANLAAYPELLHAVSDRRGGVSPVPYASLNLGGSTPDAQENVRMNRRLLYDALGIAADQVVRVALVHGARVAVPEDGDIAPEPELNEADAIVSGLPNQYALLTYADCVPILLYDPVRRITGAVHAGWRGTVAGVTRRAVETMHRRFGCRPEDILAGIGPAIGPCCYAVGPEVIDQAAATFGPDTHSLICRRNGQIYLDLPAANELHLRHVGLRAANIEQSGICTSCNTDRWFSHRAEHGQTGRFVAMIGLR